MLNFVQHPSEIYNTLAERAGKRIIFFAGGPLHVLRVSNHKKGVLW